MFNPPRRFAGKRGLIYQHYGMTTPFLVGAVVITGLLGTSVGVFRRRLLAQA